MESDFKYKIIFEKLEEAKKEQSNICKASLTEIYKMDNEIRELKNIIDNQTPEIITTFTRS